MTFTKIESYKFADPDEMINNFYYIAQQDVFPMLGADLDYNNGGVKLGNSTSVWKDIYSNSITVDYGIDINTYKLFSDVETAGTSTSIEVTSLTPQTKSYDIYFYAEGLILSGTSLYLGIGFTTGAKEICRIDYSYTNSVGADSTHEKSTVDGILVNKSTEISDKKYLFSHIKLRKTSPYIGISMEARSSIMSSVTTYVLRYDYSSCFCNSDSTNSFYFYVTSSSNFYNSKILIYEAD